MENVPEFIPPQNNQLSVPDQEPSKKGFLFLLLILIAGLIIGSLLLVLLQKNKKLPAESNTTVTPTLASSVHPTVIISNSPTPVPQNLNDYLVFLKNRDIYFTDIQNITVKQINLENASYRYLILLDQDILYYISCTEATKCSIRQIKMAEFADSALVEVNADIYRAAIFPPEQKIAYLSREGEENTYCLYLGKFGSIKRAFCYPKVLGRGGGLDDEISLSYSPDGKYLLAVNTSTQPNLNSDPVTIWVFDEAGDIVERTGTRFATNASWFDSATYLYIEQGAVYKKNIGGNAISIGPLKGHNPQLSPDRSKLAYWYQSDEQQVFLSLFDIASATSQDFIPNLIYPNWPSDNFIFAVKAKVSGDNYLGFDTEGLVRINTKTKEELLIDPGPSITQFLTSKSH